MIYKVGILGATGKMGLEIAGLLSQGYRIGSDTLELADAVGKTGKFSSVEGIDVRRPEDPPREPVHVWIDFSRPEATLKLLSRLECPVLIGTTGFSQGDLESISEASRRIPILLTSNTSRGMAQMKKWLRHSVLSDGWDTVLAEGHHSEKKDSPSGTAKSLLALLAEKGLTNVGVQVTRAGGIRGEHTVRFVAVDEEILIEHRVYHRNVFASGALRAALGLLKKTTPGLYSMEDVT